MPSDPLYIDNSTLKATAECSTHSHLRYGMGMTMVDPSRDAPALAGTAAHEGLASYLSHGDPTKALEIFSTHPLDHNPGGYRTFSDTHIPQGDRLEFSNLRTIMDQWMSAHPLVGSPREGWLTFKDLPFEVSPRLIEVPAAFPLDENGEVIITLRLDALVRDPSGDFYVLDHKTTSSLTPWSLDKYKWDSQLSEYIWAAQETLRSLGRTEQIRGAYINAIEFSRLPSDPTRRCRTHSVPYIECGPFHSKWLLRQFGRTPEAIAEWKRTALTLARRLLQLRSDFPNGWEDIEKIRTQGQFNGSCRYCEFQSWCISGRRTDPLTISSLFKKSDWSPFNRVYKEVS